MISKTVEFSERAMQIGSEPGEVEEDSTQLYGTGAFLAAAANILQLEACTTTAAPAGAPSPVADVSTSLVSGAAESPNSSPEAVSYTHLTLPTILLV